MPGFLRSVRKGMRWVYTTYHCVSETLYFWHITRTCVYTPCFSYRLEKKKLFKHTSCVEWFKPVVWTAWKSYPNWGQMWMKKLTKTRSIRHVLKFVLNALNDCSWINWHSSSEKMFNTITLCVNCWHQKILPQQSWGELVLSNTTG